MALFSVLGLLAAAAITPGIASANLTMQAHAIFSNPTPGAFSNYSVTHQYLSYDGVPSGVPGTTGDDLRRYVLEAPAGMIGNPNAIPYDQRCTAAGFATAATAPFTACPASAIVGSAQLELGVDANNTSATVLQGTIYLIQSANEIPTTLGSIFPTSPSTATVSSSVIGPMTNSDFRLQLVSDDNIARPDLGGGFVGHIKRISQTLLGVLPNGRGFITNPARCGNWSTTIFARAYDSNLSPPATTYDPLGEGTNNYVKSTVTTAPTCNLPEFRPATDVIFSTRARNSNPQVDFVVDTLGVPGNGLPKRVQLMLPPTLTTDLDALGTICEVSQADASACPAASKVGTVKIETPFLTAGLTGDVFITRSNDSTLPNLAIFVTGAINFRINATSVFAGQNGNQIVTTFDGLPQVPFSKFVVTLTGGTNTLMTIPACKANNSRPDDGPVSWIIGSYGEQTVALSNDASFNECRKVTLKKFNCVYSALRLIPVYAARANVTKAELFISGNKVATSTKSPFSFKEDVSGLSDGRHNIKVKATYASGGKAYDKSSFRKC